MQNCQSPIQDSNGLYQDACTIIEQAQAVAYRSVNEVLIKRNWLLGMRLSWTHYAIILQEDSKEARAWYENEAANEMWSTRTLQRNISSQYYHRMLQSQNKEFFKLQNG